MFSSQIAYHHEIITLKHVLLMHVNLDSDVTIIVAYPLPDVTSHSSLDTQSLDTSVLSASHLGTSPFGFAEPVQIPSKKHSNGNASSPSLKEPTIITLLSLSHSYTPRGTEVTLFDVVLSPILGSLGAISVSKIYTSSENLHHQRVAYNLLASSWADIATGVSFNALASQPFRLLGYTIRNDREGKSVVEIREIDLVQRHATDMVFDGFRGRVCMAIDSRVEIHDFI